MFPPPLLTGCDDYDAWELWENVNDLKSRIEALETKIGQMNTEIAALQKIVDDAVTVVKVEKSADGYVIYFSDNTTAEIKNGTAGADAPVIGVKQDTDEVYYWTITTDGKTEWLMAGGAKLRVTGESVKPVMSVDDEGYWTISYDGGKTSERILDAAGDPVSAVTEGSSIGSLFKSVNYDDNNVYFELSDGSIVTVPVRSNFYMLIRKAPEVATFVFGETKVWDVESAGVTKTLVSKPDEWKVTYADGKLTVTAPTEAHKECADLRGTVGITYFSANGQADAVMMDVVADADYRGETVGEDFTVNITEITDKNIKDFERIARKYGVDFALKKDKSGDIPKYLVFFKARDADALTAAFREYTAKEVKRASQDKPSVLEQLRALKAKVLSLTPDKARNKDKGLEL